MKDSISYIGKYSMEGLEVDNLEGQWIGTLDGEIGGLAILDLDVVGEQYWGTGMLFPNGAGIPGTLAVIRTSNNSHDLKLRL